MKIFLSSAHNKPSGGTKVVNDVVRMLREKNVEAYMVVPGKPERATFLAEPCEDVISFKQMQKMCTAEDILIDCWQSEIAYETAMQSPAQKKIFWQHGASIPVGPGVVGERVFFADSPYTHHWNVSRACATYIEQHYPVTQTAIVHPFFDTATLQQFQDKSLKKEGVLMLARRGMKHIQKVKARVGDRALVTILEAPFEERELLAQLQQHTFFVSVDDGIHDMPWQNKIKQQIKKILSPTFRKQEAERVHWIIPKGNLLGFPMPPVEAALLGCTVIGFAMGGGLEWMNNDNCFLAKDADQQSLLKQVDAALSASDDALEEKQQKAYNAVSQFTKEHTWQQITAALPELL